MAIRRAANSPLVVVGVALAAVGVFVWVFDGPLPAARTSLGRASALEKPTHGEESSKSASALGPRAMPRLLRPSDPSTLGLDIALEDRNGWSMAHFHDALRRAANGQGQARIVVYGASHVASEMFTNVLRRELQSRYGDAGHGFVLPVHPWPGYRHAGVNIQSSKRRWTTLRITAKEQVEDWYGLAGVAVETRRPNARGVVETGEGVRASLFELYFMRQPRGGDVDVFIDGKPKGRISTRAKQRQAAYAAYRVPDGPHRFEIRTRGNGLVRIFGLAVERENAGVILDTLGINGSRVRSHLLWNDALYREHLKRRKPDLVVLAYGTNESGDDGPIERYTQELRQVVQRVRETVPDASCLLIGPSDRPVRVGPDVFEDRPRTQALIEAQHQVALEQGCAFFDIVSFQGGPLSTVEWVAANPPYAQRDYVHFTRRGYERLGTVLLNALLERF